MSIRITGMDVVVFAYDEGLNESIIQKRTEKVLVVRAVFSRKKVIPFGTALDVNKKEQEKGGNENRKVSSIAQ